MLLFHMFFCMFLLHMFISYVFVFTSYVFFQFHMFYFHAITVNTTGQLAKSHPAPCQSQHVHPVVCSRSGTRGDTRTQGDAGGRTQGHR